MAKLRDRHNKTHALEEECGVRVGLNYDGSLKALSKRGGSTMSYAEDPLQKSAASLEMSVSKTKDENEEYACKMPQVGAGGAYGTQSYYYYQDAKNGARSLILPQQSSTDDVDLGQSGSLFKSGSIDQTETDHFVSVD